MRFIISITSPLSVGVYLGFGLQFAPYLVLHVFFLLLRSIQHAFGILRINTVLGLRLLVGLLCLCRLAVLCSRLAAACSAGCLVGPCSAGPSACLLVLVLLVFVFLILLLAACPCAFVLFLLLLLLLLLQHFLGEGQVVARVGIVGRTLQRFFVSASRRR
jgi:hypothetical protein